MSSVIYKNYILLAYFLFSLVIIHFLSVRQVYFTLVTNSVLLFETIGPSTVSTWNFMKKENTLNSSRIIRDILRDKTQPWKRRVSSGSLYKRDLDEGYPTTLSEITFRSTMMCLQPRITYRKTGGVIYN